MFRQNKGVALILVTMIIAAATVLVTSLAFSTFISGRTYGMVQNRLQAEYLAKSVFSLVVAMLDQDKNGFDGNDSSTDFWSTFSKEEVPIPSEIFASLELESVPEVTLQIEPTNSKIPLFGIYRTSTVSSGTLSTPIIWTKAIYEILQKQEFDNLPGEDHTGLFPGRNFDLQMSLSNYLDYIDNDNVGSEADPNFPKGIEDDLLDKEIFPKGGKANGNLFSYDELNKIPGFTTERIELIKPLFNIRGTTNLNVNFMDATAYEALLAAANATNAPDFAQVEAQIISAGPFKDLSFFNSFPNSSAYFTTSTTAFNVMCSIQYGARKYTAIAYISRTNNSANIVDVVWD